MAQQRPITPPPELVLQWAKDRALLADEIPLHIYIATCAAEWGYQQHERELLDAMHAVVPQSCEQEAE
jgi:hypothetical protein